MALAATLRRVVLPARRRMRTRAGTLQYVVSGAGRPSIVLMGGAGVTLEGWAALYPDVETMGTVFAWNRFGAAGSDAPRRVQSGAVVIASLRELLAYAAVPPPFVLVAHSIAGLYANLYARLYPQEIAAVMFLEAAHPGDPAPAERHEGRVARALANVLRVPQRVFRANLEAELNSVGHVLHEIECAGAFPPVPVTVVTGARQPPAWLAPPRDALAKAVHQEALVRLSPHGEQVLAAQSGHFPQVTEPQLVVQALDRLLQRVR